MLKTIKRLCLGAGKTLGAFHLVGESRWRRQRLLILCYHGISLEREHEWRPPLFMRPSDLEARLRILQRGQYSVLPLGEAIERLYARDLPGRSVALTFDDGNYDFYEQAYPLLRSYGYPATVYLSTFYSDHEYPVFHLICSYMLWIKRGMTVSAKSLIGTELMLDLRTAEGRVRALRAIEGFAKDEDLSVDEKDRLARSLAGLLGVDREALWSKRVLQMMNAREVAELSAAGIDFQLHMHHHYSPDDRERYQRNVQDNRVSIQAKTGSTPVHFCYPSGNHKPRFREWLAEEKVASATTCDSGLATPRTDPLLLPRIVDHNGLNAIEFEGWLSGAAALLPRR